MFCQLLWCSIFHPFFLNVSPLLFSINISPQTASSSSIILNALYMLMTPICIPTLIPLWTPHVNIYLFIQHLPLAAARFKLNMHREGLLMFVYSYKSVSPEFSLNHNFFFLSQKSVPFTQSPSQKPRTILAWVLHFFYQPISNPSLVSADSTSKIDPNFHYLSSSTSLLQC